MNLPPINLVVITFLRRDMLAKTVLALFENLRYAGEISWIIADDCTPEPDYHDFIRSLPWGNRKMRIEKTPLNGGWGANANNALKKCEHEIVFFIEDDYVLTRPLDLTPYVGLLVVNKAVGLVRLDGIAGHRGINCQVVESDIRHLAPTFRQGIAPLGTVHYFLIDRNSRHLNLYSNRPHLKHRRFHEHYGQYAQGLRLGHTEESFAHTVKDKMRANPNIPAIAVPMDANSYFDHIGISFQLSEYDKDRR